MSEALVKKSLEIVDPNISKTLGKSKKIENVFGFIPDNQKILVKRKIKGKKGEKINLLSKTRKITILEAKEKLKTKETILKENQKKLKTIKKACNINLDKRIAKKIIERAVSKRPIRVKLQPKKNQKTAFTEEDFKNFEAEYLA